MLILKKTQNPAILAAKSLLKNSRGIIIQGTQTVANYRHVQRTERGLLLWRKGGSWEGLFRRVQGGDSFSLA